jgi:hypothetical protein
VNNAIKENEMKVLGAAVVGLAVLVSAVAVAQERPELDESKAIKLFNGENLDGWVWFTPEEGVKMEDVWSVREDGVLHCKGKPVGYIRTEQDYESFVLKLQLRHIGKGNGGVLLRVQEPDKIWPKSVEAQGMYGALGDIWNIGEFQMTTDPERTKGRHTVKTGPASEKPQGEWNDYEIILDGGNLALIVNGVVQNQATDVEVVEGKIGLQSEGSEYEFRNIVLYPIERD